jgi:hypothetical protein
MKIEAGKYYLMRNRQFIGPVELGAFSERSWVSLGLAWAPDGSHDPENGPHQYDLIREVYVSDTPPADALTLPSAMLKPQDWRRLKPIEPSPETKTLRDEFAMAALIGLTAAGGDLVDCGRDEIAKEAWRQADAMMEAWKK